MRQLTSLDVQFLAMEDGRTHGHVSSLALYDPETATGRVLDVVLVRQLLTERLHLLPPFRWRLARVPFDLDHPYWVDDASFDVEYHVRELALPAPGDRRQLADQVARIVSRPLDRSRPLWELYVIHGLADGSVALLTKMHHAAVDGVSGAEVMSVLLDTSPEGRETGGPNGKPAVERYPGEVQMLGRGLAGFWRQPLRVLGAAPRALPHLDAVPTLSPVPGVRTIAAASRRVKGLIPRSSNGGVLEGRDLTAPRTRFQQRITAHRRIAFDAISLSEVKQVKNAFGCTVNDVVLALCAGALRTWLIERDELPAKPLVAMVPVSVRTPEQQGTYGNRVSAMLAELPTDEPDPVRRLRRVSQTMRSAKEQHRALPASLMQDANQFVPPALLARAARVTSRLMTLRGFKAPVNVVISNVPGSPQPLYCAGAKQRGTYPISAVADGVGLNITVLSYRDQLGFGIVADREQLDDAWPLLAAVRDALDELQALAPCVDVPAGPAEALREVARS